MFSKTTSISRNRDLTLKHNRNFKEIKSNASTHLSAHVRESIKTAGQRFGEKQKAVANKNHNNHIYEHLAKLAIQTYQT